MTARSVQFFIADGFEALDLAGPMAVLAAANGKLGDAYHIATIGPTSDPISTEAGPRVLADMTLSDAPAPHTLVIVGGRGVRELELGVLDRLAFRRHAAEAARILSVCTGAFLAGHLGLLDGRVTTTHWRHQDALQARFPLAEVRADRLYTRDGKLWSAAGVTSGIDAALAILRDDHGGPVAAGVARELVVYLHRFGGQSQYAQDLKAQQGASGRFADLLDWVRNNLAGDISIPALAARAGMSDRNFQRRFREEMGEPASTYMERLRVRHAKHLLTGSEATIAETARTVGFANPDTFRRAFERAYGVSPSFYRKRFHEHA